MPSFLIAIANKITCMCKCVCVSLFFLHKISYRAAKYMKNLITIIDKNGGS